MKDFLFFINNCITLITSIIIIMLIYNFLVQESITKIQNIKLL
jgi:hypothetical protein